jgi:hypothetical protein
VIEQAQADPPLAMTNDGGRVAHGKERMCLRATRVPLVLGLLAALTAACGERLRAVQSIGAAGSEKKG